MTAIIFLALPLGPYGSRTATAAQASALTDSDRIEFRKSFFKGMDPGLLDMLLAGFPGEYRAFETRIMTGLRTGTMQRPQVEREAAAFFRSVLPRMTEGWTDGPAEMYVTFVEKRIKASEGLPPEACVRFFKGTLTPDVIRGLPEAQRNLIADVSVHQVKIARVGRLAPIPHPTPTQEQLEQTLQSYRTLGGDEAWMDAFAENEEGQFGDAAHCLNHRIWLKAIAQQPPQVAASLLTH